MQKSPSFCIDENGWIHCPACRCRTRTKIRAETILKNFPVYCPQCRQEYLVDVEKMNIKQSVEPAVRAQSR